MTNEIKACPWILVKFFPSFMEDYNVKFCDIYSCFISKVDVNDSTFLFKAKESGLFIRGPYLALFPNMNLFIIPSWRRKKPGWAPMEGYKGRSRLTDVLLKECIQGKGISIGINLPPSQSEKTYFPISAIIEISDKFNLTEQMDELSKDPRYRIKSYRWDNFYERILPLEQANP